MGTVPITISENVTAALDRAVQLGGDLTPAMGEIARMMVTETQFNFEGQRDPLDVPWKPRVLHASDDGHPILRKSGDLFGSIKEDFGPDHAAAGPEASGGAAIYAAVHQWGATIRAKGKANGGADALKTPFGLRTSVTIPARAYVGWNQRMEGSVIGILGDHLKGVFNGAESPVQ